MKKFMCVILALGMILSVAACGEQTAEKDLNEIYEENEDTSSTDVSSENIAKENNEKVRDDIDPTTFTIDQINQLPTTEDISFIMMIEVDGIESISEYMNEWAVVDIIGYKESDSSTLTVTSENGTPIHFHDLDNFNDAVDHADVYFKVIGKISESDENTENTTEPTPMLVYPEDICSSDAFCTDIYNRYGDTYLYVVGLDVTKLANITDHPMSDTTSIPYWIGSGSTYKSIDLVWYAGTKPDMTGWASVNAYGYISTRPTINVTTGGAATEYVFFITQFEQGW